MSSPDPEFHPVYTAVIQRPAFWGVDQRFLPFVIGVPLVTTVLGSVIATLGAMTGFLCGLVGMVVAFVVCRWIYATEPRILSMLWGAWWLRPCYDPLKHEPVLIEVKTRW